LDLPTWAGLRSLADEDWKGQMSFFWLLAIPELCLGTLIGCMLGLHNQLTMQEIIILLQG